MRSGPSAGTRQFVRAQSAANLSMASNANYDLDNDAARINLYANDAYDLSRPLSPTASMLGADNEDLNASNLEVSLAVDGLQPATTDVSGQGAGLSGVMMQQMQQMQQQLNELSRQFTAMSASAQNARTNAQHAPNAWTQYQEDAARTQVPDDAANGATNFAFVPDHAQIANCNSDAARNDAGALQGTQHTQGTQNAACAANQGINDALAGMQRQLNIMQSAAIRDGRADGLAAMQNAAMCQMPNSATVQRALQLPNVANVCEDAARMPINASNAALQIPNASQLNDDATFMHNALLQNALQGPNASAAPDAVNAAPMMMPNASNVAMRCNNAASFLLL